MKERKKKLKTVCYTPKKGGIGERTVGRKKKKDHRGVCVTRLLHVLYTERNKGKGGKEGNGIQCQKRNKIVRPHLSENQKHPNGQPNPCEWKGKKKECRGCGGVTGQRKKMGQKQGAAGGGRTDKAVKKVWNSYLCGEGTSKERRANSKQQTKRGCFNRW